MARELDTSDTVVANPLPAADPAPLGLAGFALTTVLLSGVNAGLIKHVLVTVGHAHALTPVDAWIGMALFYGGLGQFMAGMWEFRNRNTFGATAFSSFGAFWMGYAILYFFHPAYMSAYGGANWQVVTSFLFVPWVIFTAYMTIASLRTNVAVAGTFLLLTLTMLCYWLGCKLLYNPGDGFRAAGGYLGPATSLVAWYASAAGVVNSTWGRRVLPVFPLGQIIDRYERNGRGHRQVSHDRRSPQYDPRNE